jgi:choline dehydrogenase-like flavoprotein
VLVDGREVDAGSTLRADVCIIGAGAAGITLSRALAAKGHDVLLLESGGFDPDPPTQALYRGKTVGLPIDPNEHFGLDAPRLRYFGGTTNHWAGFCRPFPALDFAVRSAVPRSGWPIDRAELDPYYAGAQDVVRLGPYDYSPSTWWDQGHIPPPFVDDDVVQHVLFQIAGDPVLGRVYHDEIVAERRIRLVLWANVTDLVLGTGGNAIERVDVRTLSGNRFRAEARAFVLATGGLEVPRLLLSSNDRRPEGIGNEHDQVGRSFMEHVNVVVGPLPLAVEPSALRSYELNPVTVDVDGESRNLSLQTVAVLAPDVQEREGLRSLEVTLEYPFTPDDDRLRDVYPGVQRGIDLLRAEGIDVRSVPSARVLCEQEPNLASRVSLVRARDALGMHRIELDWRLTRDDRLSILTSVRLMAEHLGARGLGRLRLDIGGYHDFDATAEQDLEFPVGTGSHHMGTARMSASPTEGVVDPDCKVHSVANLYIGGSAVFPTCGANPPTLTIIALALRLADHLDAAVLTRG